MVARTPNPGMGAGAFRSLGPLPTFLPRKPSPSTARGWRSRDLYSVTHNGFCWHWGRVFGNSKRYQLYSELFVLLKLEVEVSYEDVRKIVERALLLFRYSPG